MKRGDLLRHLRRHGCHLKREGRSHSLWTNPASGAVGSPAPQRNIGSTRPEGLSRTFRARDREVTLANPALQRTGCAAAAGPLVVRRPVRTAWSS